MKRNVVFVGVLVLCMFAFSGQAQLKIPKTSDLAKAAGLNIPTEAFTNDFMKALSPDTSLGLSNDQETQLVKNNSSFVSGVLDIITGAGSDSEKNKKLAILQKDRQGFIEKLLGEGKAAQYYAIVKKQVEPLITKYALSKFFEKA